MPQGIGYGPQQPGMLGAPQQQPAPGIARQPGWPPQAPPPVQNQGMGFNVPMPVLTEDAVLQAVVRMLAGGR